MAPYMYIHCTVLLQAVLKNLHIGKISQKLCMYLSLFIHITKTTLHSDIMVFMANSQFCKVMTMQFQILLFCSEN